MMCEFEEEMLVAVEELRFEYVVKLCDEICDLCCEFDLVTMFVD